MFEAKCYDAGTLGGFGKHEQTDRQTHTQDSCFISIDEMQQMIICA